MKKNPYNTVYRLLAPIVRLVFAIKAEGAENVPTEGGYLICANHTSLLDVFVMCACLKRQVMFMAKAELFKVPVLRRIIAALGAYPVNRGNADVSAIKKSVALLEGGNLVGVFPQGTRCPGVDLRTTKVHHGVGLMAYRAKCGVIPVYIETKNNKVRPFQKTYLHFQKPVGYDELGFAEGGITEYKAATEKIFDIICDESEKHKEVGNKK